MVPPLDDTTVVAAKPKKSFPLGPTLSVASFCIALYSMYVSGVTRNDVARMDIIKTEYGLYHDLAQLQLQYPLTAYLFTPTDETYDIAVEHVKRALTTQSSHEVALAVLQERAVAHYIFTTYEEAFLVWTQSQEAGDARRTTLAHDNLVYFNEAFCSNPRLLWYWDFNGGKLDRAFGEDLRTYYKANVLKGCATVHDSGGPFIP